MEERRIREEKNYFRDLISRHKASLENLKKRESGIPALIKEQEFYRDMAAYNLRMHKECMIREYGTEKPPCGDSYCQVWSGAIGFTADVAGLTPAAPLAYVAGVTNAIVTIVLCKQYTGNGLEYTLPSFGFGTASFMVDQREKIRGVRNFKFGEEGKYAKGTSRVFAGASMAVNLYSINWNAVLMYLSGDYHCEP